MSRKIYGLTEVLDGHLHISNGNVTLGTDDFALNFSPFAGLTAGVRVAGEGGSYAFNMITYAGAGTYPGFIMGRSLGTNASPSALTSGSTTGQFYFTAFGASSFFETASIESVTTQNTTDSASGGNLRFRTTPNNSTSSQVRMLIDQNGEVGIGTVAPNALLHVNGSSSLDGTVIVNESGNSTDFRVESNTMNQALIVSGTGDSVGIGGWQSNVQFRVEPLSTKSFAQIISSSNTTNQTLLYLTSVGAATTTTGLQINIAAGTNRRAIIVDRGDVTFNDSSESWDFRVESNNETHMLFVDGSGDGVGIGVSAPASPLDVDGIISHRGPAGNTVTSPHYQVYHNGQSQPIFQHLNWSSDNNSLGFGMYWDGTWRSGDAGSNFQIYKEQDAFKINYDSGITVGSAVSMNGGIALTTSGYVKIGGFSQIGTVTSNARLHVVESLGTVPTMPTGVVAIFQNNQATTNDSAICILGGAVVNSQIFFGDANDADVGRIEYNHIQNDIQFTTNGSTDNGPLINQNGTLETKGNGLATRYTSTSGTSFIINLTSNDHVVVGNAVGGRLTPSITYNLPDVATDGLIDGQEIIFRTLLISTANITINSGTGGAIIRNLSGVDVASQACSANQVYRYIWITSLGRWVQIQ